MIFFGIVCGSPIRNSLYIQTILFSVLNKVNYGKTPGHWQLRLSVIDCVLKMHEKYRGEKND